MFCPKSQLIHGSLAMKTSLFFHIFCCKHKVVPLTVKPPLDIHSVYYVWHNVTFQSEVDVMVVGNGDLYFELIRFT